MCSSLSNGLRAAASRLALAAMLLLAASYPAAAPPSEAANADGKARVRPGSPVAYPPYAYPGACIAYCACAGWRWDEHRKWRRPVAPDAPAPVDPDIWGTTGSPWGYVRRLPPPTPAAHIQPRYREASTIRPEFDEPASEGAASATPPPAASGASR